MAALEARGIEVHGDLADLVPALVPPTGPDLDQVSDTELLAATRAALASLALDHGRLFRRYRREFTAREGRLPGVAEVLASQARAGGFWFRKWALHRADRSRLVAMAAHAYADRTSGSRIGP